MENNHQEAKCSCNKEDKSLEFASILPLLLGMLATINHPLEEPCKFERLSKLESRLSILEDEVNQIKKII